TTVGIIGAQDEDVGELVAASGNGDSASRAPAEASPEAEKETEKEAPADEAASREPEASPSAQPETPAPVRAEGERAKASPLARRIARERGIDLAQIAGTGPEGRVIAEDVEKASLRPAAQAPAATVAAAETEVVELTSTRRTIARRLTEAWQAPVFQLTV